MGSGSGTPLRKNGRNGIGAGPNSIGQRNMYQNIM
jgi:hypothetical protein